MKKPSFLGGIKAKLISATCMMLIAVIMVVSSTFAWFTLSTAPEVTGIVTSVGANGALEMALSSLSGDVANLGVNETDINRTWGNIVDLGKTNNDQKNIYGLDLLNLYPSTLLTNPGTTTLKSSPVGTPIYGSDGRVASVKENGTVGKFTGSIFEANELTHSEANSANGYGVRAIGVSSSMSEREIMYRNYLSAASTNAGLAKSTAIASLNSRGADLANVGIKHATASANESYNDEDLGRINDALLDLIGIQAVGDMAGKTGVYGYMWDAMLNFEAAHQSATGSVASGLLSITLENVAADSALALADSFTNAKLKALYPIFKASYDKVLAAKASVDGLIADTAKTSYTWTDISGIVNCLVDTDRMTINGIPVSEVKTRIGDLVNSAMSGGLKLVLASGAGVYADIADFCGNYAANITLEKIEYNGMEVKNLAATMQTETSVSPVYLTKDHVTPAAFTEAGGNTAAKPLNTFYGYIIDLAFRTNAADSKLQLQIPAIDRIYSDNTVNEETMGHGTSMSFSSPDAKFTSQKIATLMGALRVVFFDTNTASIIGYARLNPDSQFIADGEVTMSLHMCNENGTPIVDDESTTGVNEAISIVGLNQNEVRRISVLVYLEGDPNKGGVDNSMVAAEAEGGKSLVGTMNLQFSSSANLVPMEYDDLRNGGSSVEGTTAPQYTRFTNISVTGAENVTVEGGFTGTNGAITVIGLAEGQTVTATVGGESVALTAGSAGGYTGYTFTAPSSVTLAADTQIVITVSNG